MILAPHRRKAFRTAASSIPSPTHYYVMSGTGGETDTGTGTARDLTEVGAVTETTGKNGNARNGFSASNYLQNLSLDADYPSSVTWSAAVWLKHNTGTMSSATATFVEGTVDSASLISFNSGTNLTWGTSTSLNHTVSAPGTSWHLVAFGWDQTNRWLTMDNATPSTVAGGYRALLETWGEYGGWYWNGLMDEVSIFNADIRGAALTELYNSGTGKFWNGSAWT